MLCGSDFWLHLTGDKNFYNRLLKAMGEVLDEGVERISSNDLSHRMKVTASQIRQDLNNFGGFGQRDKANTCHRG